MLQKWAGSGYTGRNRNRSVCFSWMKEQMPRCAVLSHSSMTVKALSLNELEIIRRTYHQHLRQGVGKANRIYVLIRRKERLPDGRQSWKNSIGSCRKTNNCGPDLRRIETISASMMKGLVARPRPPVKAAYRNGRSSSLCTRGGMLEQTVSALSRNAWHQMMSSCC